MTTRHSAIDGRRQRTVTSRAHILDAAEQLFGAGGFHGTSLRSLATFIGMSHAGVLRHFSTKGELLVALLERLDEREDAAYAANLMALPMREVVRTIAEQWQSTSRSALYTVLLGEAMAPDHPARPNLQERIDAAHVWLGAAFGGASVEIYGTWVGLQLLRAYLPDVSVPDLLDIVVADSLAPSPAPSGPVADVTVRLAPPRAGAPRSREHDIVTAATTAFAEHGYRATTLRQLADSLGISHGSLLYYFESKDALLQVVLERRDQSDESLPWTYGDGALDYLYGLYLQALHNESEPELTAMFSTLACEATDPAHPAHPFFTRRFTAFRAELAGHLRALVKSGDARADIDPDREALVLIGLWDGLGLSRHYRAVGDVPERLRERINSLLTVTLLGRESVPGSPA